MKSLTVEQLAALRRFSETYGYNWKARLKSFWASGKDDTLPDGALLRQIRNELGPKWLSRFSLSNPVVQSEAEPTTQACTGKDENPEDAVKSAILVYEDEGGNVIQRYCTPAEAKAYEAGIAGQLKGCSVFLGVAGTRAEMLMSVSPGLRARVEEARANLQRDVRLRNLLTRYGVPEDRALRASIHAAFEELQSPA